MNPVAPIVCLGEFLWDMLPDGRQPGGAPFNVARHLRHLGQPVQLISRVGDDELGTDLLRELTAQGLGPELIQHSQTHLTGVVKVTFRHGHATYKVVEPVAWDYLQHTNELRDTVAASRMLVYGSLAARGLTTRETLYRLLQVAPYKVFDVNLRAPHYTRSVVQYLLRQADLVKLNESELTEIMSWLSQPDTPATALPWLAAHFGLQAVCLTQGTAGATLWHGGHLLEQPGFAVAVQDTLGSSDAFLAALLADWPTASPAASLRRACAAAALVATHLGTAPPLSETAILDLTG